MMSALTFLRAQLLTFESMLVHACPDFFHGGFFVAKIQT